MHSVFWIKSTLALLALVATIALIFLRAPALDRATPRLLIISYYMGRLLFLAVAIFFLHFKYQGENTAAYFHLGELTLQGQIPNRDFYTVYGILFSYALAAAIWIWHEPFVIYAFLQLAEFAAIYVLFTQKNVPLNLRSFLGYALNPVTLICIWFGLQNQVLCLMAIAALFAVRNEDQRSVWFALCFSLSKMFALWTIVPALAFQRARSVIACGAIVLLIYGPFMLAGSIGISSKATQANGSVANDATDLGVQSLIRYLPEGWHVQAGHDSLLATEGALAFVLLVPWLLRWRMGEAKIVDSAGFEKRIVYASIFAVLLMLIFQAFSPYTLPEYIITVVAFVPILVKSGFWSKGDHIFFLVICYLQATVALLWFHFSEFGNPDPRTSPVYTTAVILDNACIVFFCLYHAVKAFRYFRGEDLRSWSWSMQEKPTPIPAMVRSR